MNRSRDLDLYAATTRRRAGPDRTFARGSYLLVEGPVAIGLTSTVPGLQVVLSGKAAVQLHVLPEHWRGFRPDADSPSARTRPALT